MVNIGSDHQCLARHGKMIRHNNHPPTPAPQFDEKQTQTMGSRHFTTYFKGGAPEGPRREIFYFSDNADLMAVRYNAWKLNFKTIVGNLFTGKEDSTNVPVVTNLRQDPWERYQTEGMLYGRWWGEKLWTMVPAIQIVGEFLATFEEYPPSQASGTFSVERALTMLQEGTPKN